MARNIVVKKIMFISMCALSMTLCASKGRYYNKISRASSEVLGQTIAQLNSKKNTIIKHSKGSVQVFAAQEMVKDIKNILLAYQDVLDEIATLKQSTAISTRTQEIYESLFSEASFAIKELSDAKKILEKKAAQFKNTKKISIKKSHVQPSKNNRLTSLIPETITSYEDLELQLYWISLFQKAGVDVKELYDECFTFLSNKENTTKYTIQIMHQMISSQPIAHQKQNVEQ